MDQQIEIILNGEATQISAAWSIVNLIEHLDLMEKQVAVELNGQVIGRDQWSEHLVKTGDRIEIVHFVGGGGGWDV